MKIEKSKINLLLARWIKWDGELWAELREVQIKLLHERIVKEISFEGLAAKYNVSTMKIRQIFAAILYHIECSHGKQIASLLRQINTELDAIQTGVKQADSDPHPFRKVFLN